jgi:hypothetical protein
MKMIGNPSQLELCQFKPPFIPYWCKDPTGGRKPINAKCETVRDLPTRCRAAPGANDDGMA